MSRFALFESLEQRICFRVEGVDVSVFQGAINWNTLAANNKQFAFVRSSRTNLDLDPNLHQNMAGAKAAGVLTGVYQRVLPMGEAEGGVYTDPITDANRFYNAGGQYMGAGYLRPVIDAEDGQSLGKAVLSKWVNDFSTELTRLSGVVPIIYASSNYATNFLDTTVAAKHDFWIARWNGGNANNVNPQTDQPETAAGYVNPYGSWNNPVGGAPSHSSWDFWQYTSNGDGIALGVSSSRLDLDVFNGDMEQLKQGFLTGYQFAFGNTPITVGAGTSTLEAEKFDNGGQGIAFNDTTARNIGGAYRPNQPVDIKTIAGTSGQYRISDAVKGEWLEYTVNVARAGQYKLDFRVGNRDPGATFHLERQGAGNITGALSVPDTNSFDAFATVSKVVTLPAGKQVLRFAFDNNATNGYGAALDWIKLTPAAASNQVVIGTGIASYVRGGSFASQNFGNSSELRVKKSGISITNTRETYLKFDLSSVSSITSAKLQLVGRLSDTQNSSLTLNVYNAFDQSWTETGLKNNNKPAAGKSLRGQTTITGTSNATREVDLSNLLRAEKLAGRNVVTLVLKAANPTHTQAIFASDETGNGPRLVINT